MVCKYCQGKSKDGSPCKRKASCHVDCYDFCWQHAEKWNQTKGCTGKRLYQYRKKSGPKSGRCGSNDMIGASGRCVKRTSANLKAKKEALAKRKLGKTKKDKKKIEYPAESSDEDPFMEIGVRPEESSYEESEGSEYIPEESSEEPEESSEEPEESSEEPEESSEEPKLSSGLQKCQSDVVEFREKYLQEKKDKDRFKGYSDTIDRKYNSQLEEVREKEQDIASCRDNLEQLKQQYEKELGLFKENMDDLTNQQGMCENNLREQMAELESSQNNLRDLQTKYKKETGNYKEALSIAGQKLRAQQLKISSVDRELSLLRSDYDELLRRSSRDIDRGRFDEIKEQYEKQIEEKEEELKRNKQIFQEKYNEFEINKELNKQELFKMRNEIKHQKEEIQSAGQAHLICKERLSDISLQFEKEQQINEEKLSRTMVEIENQREEIRDMGQAHLNCKEALTNLSSKNTKAKEEFETLEQEKEDYVKILQEYQEECNLEKAKYIEQLDLLQQEREQEKENYEKLFGVAHGAGEDYNLLVTEVTRLTQELKTQGQDNESCVKILEEFQDQCNLDKKRYSEQLTLLLQEREQEKENYDTYNRSSSQMLEASRYEINNLKEQLASCESDYDTYKRSSSQMLEASRYEINNLKEQLASCESDYDTYKRSSSQMLEASRYEMDFLKEQLASCESDYDTYKRSSSQMLEASRYEMDFLKEKFDEIEQEKERLANFEKECNLEKAKYFETISMLQQEQDKDKKMCKDLLSALRQEQSQEKRTCAELLSKNRKCETKVDRLVRENKTLDAKYGDLYKRIAGKPADADFQEEYKSLKEKVPSLEKELRKEKAASRRYKDRLDKIDELHDKQLKALWKN